MLSGAGCAALLLAASTSATAQTQELGVRPEGPSRFISTNPFLPLFGYFSGEYEQRLKDNVAFAISGSHVRFDDRYTNLDVKLRLYPNDRALQGFGLSSSLGMAWIRRVDNICFDRCEDVTGKAFTTPSFAIEGSYQWLLGRSRSTAITVGFGAKRYLSGSSENYRDVERVVPTGRLSIGYGF